MISQKKVVYFSMRPDYITKPGGDVSLLNSFAELINNADDGFTAEIGPLELRPNWLQKYSVVISANIDRPITPYKQLEACRKTNVPFLLYALHHPHIGITEYLKNTNGFRSFLARLSCFDPLRYENLNAVCKMGSSIFKKGRFISYKPVEKCSEVLLKHSSAVLVTSTAEEREIKNDLSEIVAPVYTLPHVLDVLDEEYKEAISPNRIVVAGRIESRKNQLFCLEVAKRTPNKKFIFVGSRSPTETGYFDIFIKRIEKIENCEYHGALTLSALYELLASSEKVVTGSHFEVTSLIDLFCLAYQIPLVASANTSYLEEFDESNVLMKYERGNIDDCVSKIQRDIALPESLRKLNMNNLSRDEVSKKLINILENTT